MEHTVNVTKGRNGWKATTRIKLAGKRVLEFNTSKRTKGGVNCIASVHVDNGNGVLTFELFGDFHKEVAVDANSRCTEKSVKALHAAALAKLETIQADAVAFYVAKDAKQPAQQTA